MHLVKWATWSIQQRTLSSRGSPALIIKLILMIQSSFFLYNNTKENFLNLDTYILRVWRMSDCNRKKNIFLSLMPMTDLLQNPAADLNRDVVYAAVWSFNHTSCACLVVHAYCTTAPPNRVICLTPPSGHLLRKTLFILLLRRHVCILMDGPLRPPRKLSISHQRARELVYIHHPPLPKKKSNFFGLEKKGVMCNGRRTRTGRKCNVSSPVSCL